MMNFSKKNTIIMQAQGACKRLNENLLLRSVIVKEKRLRPLEILYEYITVLLLLVLVEVCIILIGITEGTHTDVSVFVTFGVIYILLLLILNEDYHKQLIIVYDKKIVIEKKIKELKNEKEGDKWKVQRDEIITDNIFRIGYSMDLYGKELYFYRYKTRGYRSEIVIEMKNGEKSAFDIYFFLPWQQAIILKALTVNREVIITGSLKEGMSKRSLKKLLKR